MGGGAESEFVSYIPKIKKEIRRNVVEKERKDSLLVLVNGFEKEIKKYEKGKSKIQKNLYKTSADRSKSTVEFLEAYDAYYQSTMNLISSLIDYRMLFQDQVTEEELVLIAEKALESKKKDQKKLEKGEKKAQKELSAFFADINKAVIKHVEDAARADTIVKTVDQLERTVYIFIAEAREVSLGRKKILNNKNISREEIHELYAESGKLRFQGARDYAHFREESIRLTSEKEWKAINKELKPLMKN